jgi:hypothetical protein
VSFCHNSTPIKTYRAPFQITENDDLSKSICRQCCAFLEKIRSFFESCFNTNQAQIIHFRKTRGSPLDLDTHINQYVRAYQPPLVPQIKLEPSSMCDVDFDVPEYDDDEGEENYDDDEDDEDEEDEDYDQGRIHTNLSTEKISLEFVPKGIIRVR